ncbi:MAG: HAD-superfamily hydrolase, subfamily IA, variant 1, partial [uncultured Corynebacteriales bacterium]
GRHRHLRRRRDPRRHQLPARPGLVPGVPPLRPDRPAVAHPPLHRDGRRPVGHRRGRRAGRARARGRPSRRLGRGVPAHARGGPALRRREAAADRRPGSGLHAGPGQFRPAGSGGALSRPARRPGGRGGLDHVRRRRAHQAGTGPPARRDGQGARPVRRHGRRLDLGLRRRGEGGDPVLRRTHRRLLGRGAPRGRREGGLRVPRRPAATPRRHPAGPTEL